MMRNSLSIFNFKKKCIGILKILAISIVIILIVCKINNVLQGKSNHFSEFYNLPENSVDVLFVGSSHVHCSIMPLELWKKDGISAYDFSAGSQTVWYSYAYIEEALKKQHPQVIFLDVFTTVSDNEEFYAQRANMNLLGMRPSATKYRIAKESGYEKYRETFLNLPIYHSTYGAMRFDNFLFQNENLSVNAYRPLGYHYIRNTIEYEKNQVRNVNNTVDRTPISSKNEKYLRECIELCKDEGVEIVLINAPSPEKTEADQAKYNYVMDIAGEYGIDFINGWLLDDEIGMDWAGDSMGDGGHLNISGARKFTDYIGNYLRDNYQLQNHKDDEKYEYWSNVEKLDDVIINGSPVCKMDNLESVLNCLGEEDSYIYAISIEQCDNYLDEDIKNLLLTYGIKPHDGYAIIRKGSEQLEESAPAESIIKSDIGMADVISVKSGFDNNGLIEQGIYLTNHRNGEVIGTNCDAVEQGINIVVYDLLLNQVVAKVGFDATNNWKMEYFAEQE